MQTAKRGCELSDFIASIQITLDFHSYFTNPVSFVPVNFGETYRITTETHVGNPFSLSPTSMSKAGSQLLQLSNRETNRDRFSIGNFSEEFKVYFHGRIATLFVPGV